MTTDVRTPSPSWSTESAARVAALPLIGLFVLSWLALREAPAAMHWSAAAFLLFAASPVIAGWASLQSRNAGVSLAVAALVAAVLIAIATWISLPANSRPGMWMGPTVRGMGLAAIVFLPLGWWFSASRAAKRLQAGQPWAAVRVAASTMFVILALASLVAAFVPIY